MVFIYHEICRIMHWVVDMWLLSIWIMPIKQLIFIIKSIFNTGLAGHGSCEEKDSRFKQGTIKKLMRGKSGVRCDHQWCCPDLCQVDTTNSYICRNTCDVCAS
jgi:hypothetical protein